MKKIAFFFCSSILLMSFTITSCNDVGNKNSSFGPEERYIDSEQPIDLVKYYLLDHYLDPYFGIYYPYLYFVIKDDKSLPEYEYTPSSFLPEKYLNYVSNHDGFVRLEKNSRPSCANVGLVDDGKERAWFSIKLDYPFLIKDFLDLLEESKKKDYIYFVYGSRGGGGAGYPSGIWPANGDLGMEDSLVNKNAMRLFDNEHNGLDGFYREFNICIAEQASGYKEYSFDEVFFSFYLNTDATFKRIDSSKEQDMLNKNLPKTVNKTKRDWYQVIFPYKIEAQYALQLYKELELNAGVFYATSPLCTESAVDSQIPLFRVYN